jgi:hypothetical protein
VVRHLSLCNIYRNICPFRIANISFYIFISLYFIYHDRDPRLICRMIWCLNLFFPQCLVYGWRKVEAGLKKYKTDIIISVHPLMQHIALWVLKCQGLQNRVAFATVISNLFVWSDN